MNIKILKIKRIEKGNLKGFADISLEGIVIRDFRVIKQENQPTWISPPQNEYKGKDGKKKYYPIVELPEELKEKIRAEVLKAWE